MKNRIIFNKVFFLKDIHRLAVMLAFIMFAVNPIWAQQYGLAIYGLSNHTDDNSGKSYVNVNYGIAIHFLDTFAVPIKNEIDFDSKPDAA